MLKAVDLTYTVGHRFLLKNIHLQFAHGALHGILGPNGSGKTTLLKMLSGLWNPSQGTVIWGKENLLHKSRLEISRIITFVPQNPHIPFEFTVEQFVEMGLYAQGQSSTNAQRQEQIKQTLETVGASTFLAEPINALSQGERQRIYIARAIITKAPVLALDEPTANLDLKHQKMMWHLLKSLATQGRTILMATHDFEACQHYCDFAHILESGSVSTSGPNSEVMTAALYRSFLGLIN